MPRPLRSVALGAAAGVALAACGAGHDGIALDAPRVVTAPTTVGTAPMFALSPRGVEALAWVSAPDGGTDGRLYVSVAGAPPAELRDPLGPIEAHGEAPPRIAWAPDGSLAALYVVGRVVQGARFPQGALRYARSADGGAHWSPPVTVTDDSAFGSHNFHALHIGADGTVYAAWLDGRAGRSAPYVTTSRDGGRTWSANRRASTGESCPCCRTAIATAPDGTAYLAWRMVLPGHVRDIVVARSSDAGNTWSAPVRVHADDWVFDACPHAGPSMQVDADGTVHIAWWTGKDGAAGVYAARSTDGARTFRPPVALGTARFSRPSHVQLALGGHGTVVVAWDDGTRREPPIVLRRSRDGGRTFGPRVVLSRPGRAASYPVLALLGDSLRVAWTEQSPDAAARAEHAHPDLRDPRAVMGLEPVGETQVVVRRGTLR